MAPRRHREALELSLSIGICDSLTGWGTQFLSAHCQKSSSAWENTSIPFQRAMDYNDGGKFGIASNVESVTWRAGKAVVGSNPTLTARIESISYR